ncbi:MAG TPA: hypothetical protein VFY46_00205 [Acidimicrobiia bacterium]|nr:hypothetical protein [Acidimicrobiia bacterium]
MNRLEVFQIEVAPEVRERQLREISAKVATAPRRRRRFALVLVGAILLVPLAAVAAEDSLPGELLYPVKRILEPVRALFDEEVVADHRVDELEILVARRTPRPEIERPVREAEEAVASRGRPDLIQRLEALIDRIEKEPQIEPTTTTTATTRPDTTVTTSPLDTSTTRPPETTTTSARPSTDSATTVPTRDSTRP